MLSIQITLPLFSTSTGPKNNRFFKSVGQMVPKNGGKKEMTIHITINSMPRMRWRNAMIRATIKRSPVSFSLFHVSPHKMFTKAVPGKKISL